VSKHRAPRAAALSSFVIVSLSAASALAITDPSQPPEGTAVVMGQPPPPPQGAPAQVMGAPPPRIGAWLQARAGGGLQFMGGTQGNAFGSLAGGYVLPQGVGFTGYGSARYLFSPTCSGANCTGAAGAGYLDIELGLILRYTALPQARLHPVGEIGGQIHVMPAGRAFGLGYGGQLAAGIEFDLTDSLSLDALARGQVFVTAWSNSSGIPDLIGVRIEPVVGLTYYF
jgi:hypothetical protein